MRIHKEGLGTITVTSGLIAILLVVVVIAGASALLITAAAIGSALLLAFILQFFRDPPRSITLDSLALLAPADGKVVAIEETIESDFLRQECRVIAIFMNVHNIHVNRAPSSGEVVYRKYHKGRYLLAWNPKSSHLNERTSLAIRNQHGTTLTRQIAGGLARRIVTYPNVGDQVEQGSQIGFIKFGSRVDLFFPKSYKVKVRLGQKVTGGKTILAQITN